MRHHSTMKILLPPLLPLNLLLRHGGRIPLPTACRLRRRPIVIVAGNGTGSSDKSNTNNGWDGRRIGRSSNSPDEIAMRRIMGNYFINRNRKSPDERNRSRKNLDLEQGIRHQ